MTNTRIRRQDLRSFTVQIRHPKTESIVGTGVVVSTEGKIITCAHVIIAAGINPRIGKRIPATWEFIIESIFGNKLQKTLDINNTEVKVYFPERNGHSGISHRAVISAYFDYYEDDIVLLQLIDANLPLSPDQVAILGNSESSEGNSFFSYGYSPTGQSSATRAHGIILGSIESSSTSNLKQDMLQLSSSNIDKGMSGAAVLDTARNLVVGFIASRHHATIGPKKNISYAVDSYTVHSSPFNIEIQQESFPLNEDFQANITISETITLPKLSFNISLNDAPELIKEWVGRTELLGNLDTHWLNSTYRLIGLIGFGGEGKSTLVRHWLDNLLKNKASTSLDGVFWWNFYENGEFSEFSEALLGFLTRNNTEIPYNLSSYAHIHFIAAIITKYRYIFVLDGLEVLQHQYGDLYGAFTNTDMRDLLSYIANPVNQSVCIITSRIPLFDLQPLTTFMHIDVDRLSIQDGRDLLRNLGVNTSENTLDQIVSNWDGHALTLSLIGTYLADNPNNQIESITQIIPSFSSSDRHEHIARILRHYDNYLSREEKILLTLSSVFRLPATMKALNYVCRKNIDGSVFNLPLIKLDSDIFGNMLDRLIKLKLIRCNLSRDVFSMHPLIRDYYLLAFDNLPTAHSKIIQGQIREYYYSIAKEITEHSKISDLTPWVEFVHHGCRAGLYNETYDIQDKYVNKGNSALVSSQFDSWDIQLSMMLEFFPNRDVTKNPLISEQSKRNWILNEVSLCLTNIGNLTHVTAIYNRVIRSALKLKDWRRASITYLHLMGINTHLGNLRKAVSYEKRALELAREVKADDLEYIILNRAAWIAHQLGKTKKSSQLFREANALHREEYNDIDYLFECFIQQAEHLRAIGDLAEARTLIQKSLQIAEIKEWHSLIADCKRVFAEIEADIGLIQDARIHFESALRIIRNIPFKPILIEILSSYGRWCAIQRDTSLAQTLLYEALSHATTSGYKISEANVRIGLAWVHLVNQDLALAIEEARIVERISKSTEFYWGHFEAIKILSKASE